LQLLLAAIRDDKVDVVVVYKIDRDDADRAPPPAAEPFAVTQLDLRVLAISGDAHPQSSAEFRQCINARQRNSAASLALSPACRLSTGAANPAVPQKARKTRCFLPRFAGSLRPPKALR